MFHRSNGGVRWQVARWLAGLTVCAALGACGGGGGGSTPAPVGDPVDSSLDNVLSNGTAQAAQTDQILVRLVDELAGQQFEERAAEYARALSQYTGVEMRSVRQTGSGSVVLALPKAMGEAELDDVVQRLMQNDAVAYAEPDARALSDVVVPNDTRWDEQWSLAPAVAAPAAVQAQAAWTLTSGSPAVVVAVLDSGILPHVDLFGRVLPGHDFVSNLNYGNDGNGRDADATDPGDWVDGSEDWLQGENTRNSGWHGTHVAGIIAAQRGNSQGISGVDARARLLPVRVLGRGGGYISDVADGLMWAVGAPVAGVPANPTPARVANLSLGGSGRCSREMQNALDEARARGVVVVASAGNLSQNVSATVLASCQRLLVTASVGKGGEMASYSNFGAGVTLAAPGGNAASDTGVLSLGDSGKQGPALDNSYRRKRGTSMAAPHVAGTAALMLAANPGLTPAQVEALLRASTRPFVKGTNKDCTPERCGAGMLDTAAAVSLAALYPAHSPLGSGSLGTESVVAEAPEAGWWRDATDPSRQAFVDLRGDEVLLSLQFRDAAGRPSWGHARLVVDTEAGDFVGRLIAFEGGGTLTSDARAPRPAADLGEVRWSSIDATSARVSTPSGNWTLARDRFGGAATQTDGRTGVWWADERPGLGFLLEQQGPQLRVGVHAFADNGRASWYVVMLSRGTDGAYRGQWQQASETLPHKLLPLPGIDSEWVWLSSLEGRLRLPNGRHITLRASVNSDMAEARGQSANLLGIWRASYVLSGSFSERWTLAHLRPSEVNAGDYNVWGVNQWGGTLVGGWSSRYANHSLYAPGLAFDDFYRFQFNDDGLKGCYHHYHIALATLSACYPFTAEQVGGAGEALSALPNLSVGAVGDRSKETMLWATLGARAVTASAQSASATVVAKQPDAALAQLRDWQRQLAGLR
ncbi:MAG: S8 family peptidase [Hydrogenophaga sp.]|uniref:S8 family peptidase n=1 Tax=Hydrogenophaga sp. TaxID=1904254 RepID=UPI002736223D|nr:S8 family peptidase [Hydrogenophaga sp.]MDP3625203.1 S8 family peptidase [Hydrogenophaga sp.]